MVIRVRTDEFVEMAREQAALDVRSPGEFELGHIPGAMSFPLFTDEERAEVGTLYKQVGQDQAVKRGLELVQPKVGEMYGLGLQQAHAGRLLVHCWRGGKRSESVAWLLSVSGVKVYVLEGGYKAFRQWVLTSFDLPIRPLIVGGMTGSGKTEVLHTLAQRGQAILDLESLAAHRGSAFGALGTAGIPRPAQFENELAWQLSRLRPQPFWAEDESRNIGKLTIPPGVWQYMEAAPVFVMHLPRAVRIERLLADYAHFPPEALRQSIEKLGRNLGGLRLREVLTRFEAGHAADVAEMLLEYYDRGYTHGLDRRKPEQRIGLHFEQFDAQVMAATLEEAARPWIQEKSPPR